MSRKPSAVLLFAAAMVAIMPALADGPIAEPQSICSVQRELYIAHPAPGVAADVVVAYLGGGLRRREIHSTQARSDIAATMSIRYSDDNGRTWSPFEPLRASEDLKQNGNGLEQLYYAAQFDSA